MANKITVGLNLFTIDQKVIVSSASGDVLLTANVPLDRIGETVAALAQTHDVDKVNLFGQDDFVSQPAYDTKFYLNKLFSENNNVRIFINGEIFN